MKTDFNQIKELLKNGNLAEVSRETGIAYRTLQDWKLEKNKWLQQAEERLTKLQTYIEENDKMKFENLQAVHFDGQHGKGDGYYTLEFNIDGEIEYIEVDEKDHPEAATDEDYFDNREIVDKIIAKK